MAKFRTRPVPEGVARNRMAVERRSTATGFSSRYAAVPTEFNRDEQRFDSHSERFPTSFTKGLVHDEYGQLARHDDYRSLVNHINAQDAESFDRVKRGLDDPNRLARTRRKKKATRAQEDDKIKWRGWESPRAGHYYDLQGPDADAVGMPPAPELGSEELTAEMAEVYALALLRDVPFHEIANPASTAADHKTKISVAEVMAALRQLTWFAATDAGGLKLQERRRRAARRVDPNAARSASSSAGYDVDEPPDDTRFDAKHAFRGSAPASKAGPHVSQFMLRGNQMVEQGHGFTESYIEYGRQLIDQKIESFEPHQDFMVHWNAYLDVQEGADFRPDSDCQIVRKRRFITTPRDLAAYVRYDALYQAYLNACLFMLGNQSFMPQQSVDHPYSGMPGPGFPDGNRGDRCDDRPASRQAFAQFGGPHVLSLVTEVATRCLKAVRRQKFNYHRRARPERIGALLTLAATKGTHGCADKLGSGARGELQKMLRQAGFPELLELVNRHNRSRQHSHDADPHLDPDGIDDPEWFEHAANYLLPMAFAEGSPMHPSYGAGHATVAGGCVTMLKAFFHTTKPDGSPEPWPADALPVVESRDGDRLVKVDECEGMTITGELNKLAANISIGRNMAGVHYYTDYYESLRMGERIAVGILIEQMKHYNEPVEFSLESFDGDHVHLLKNDFDAAEPRVYVHDAKDRDIGIDAWWHRHQCGENRDAVQARFATRPEERRSSQSTEAA